MAKKSSPTLDLDPSPPADPFDGSGVSGAPLEPPPPLRTGPTCGQVIGGCLEIILVALIFLLVCSLISGGAVYLGQQQGLLAAEPPGAPPTAPPSLLATVPTVAPLGVPTLAAETAAERTLEAPGAAATETATGLVCADGAAWWFSQQAAFDPLASALTEAALGAENPDAVRLRVTAQRDALQDDGAPPCLERPHASLVRAFDETLAGLDALATGDTAAVTARTAAVTGALADTLVALWEDGVFTALDAPTTRQIAQGSGAGCAEDWRVAFTEIRDSFTVQADEARTATALNRNLAVGQLTALRDRAAALGERECVREVDRLALQWMDARIDSLRALAAGDAATDRDNQVLAARTAVQLRAWQTWLELPAF